MEIRCEGVEQCKNQSLMAVAGLLPGRLPLLIRFYKNHAPHSLDEAD